MLDSDDEAPTASELILLQYGVEPAHMGWCETDHILNSRPLDQTRDFFDT
ncbi:MAG: hypothetical protein SVU32_07155 [Candidatus Nanohaloarchaea archaeon]|nr:hypothetical protein [Candidatus Nanohaloarchaea archaeon]